MAENPANRDGAVTFILLSYARPQNIQRILDAMKASKYCARIILSNNQPTINILDYIKPPGDGLEVIQQKEETLPINRFMIARACPGEFFVCIDDDIFLTPRQIDTLIAALIQDPARPHGIWGQDFWAENSAVRVKYGVHDVSREVTVLNRVYAFTRTHVQRFFRILDKLGCVNPQDLGPADDIVLSFSGIARPFCHNVGALESCPTSNREGIALWKGEDFDAQRKEILLRIVALQKNRRKATQENARQSASPVGQRATPGLGTGVPKIFGIGLSRTGTTSLTGALDLLGFPTIHYPTHFRQIEAHAAATDITVSLVFEELDRRFPGSYFIMTMRSLEPWLESCERLWKKNAETFARNPMVMKIEKQFYGGEGFNRRQYIDSRDRHLSAVDEYFRHRPNDLLYLELFENPDPWQSLCSFLHVPRPNCPFPHQNRADVVDRILLRLLENLDDVGEVARITLVSEKYLMKLSNEGASIGLSTPILLEEGFEQVRILKRGCAVLGTRQIAKILNLDHRQLEAYIRGQKGS